MRALSNDLPHPQPLGFFVWYPNPDRLGLDGSELMRVIDKANLPFIRRNIRVPYKLDFSSRLHALEFLSQKQGDWDEIQNFIKSAQNRFGGEAFVFNQSPTNQFRFGSIKSQIR
jgi:hypothetical protein